MALEAEGRFAEAKDAFIEAIAIDERYGEYNTVLATRYNNLGHLELNLGNYRKASNCFIAAIQIGKANFGEGFPDLFFYYNNLALVDLHGWENFEEAKRLFNQAIDVYFKYNENEDDRLARAYCNLGNAELRLGDHSEAKFHLDKALDICTNILGDEHPLLATVCSSLALFYQDVSAYEKAKSYIHWALEIDKKCKSSA
jgi:tetratricopeptide (TPR) repeat protein